MNTVRCKPERQNVAVPVWRFTVPIKQACEEPLHVLPTVICVTADGL